MSGEKLAALLDGVPQFAVGASVDVIDGCGKGEAGAAATAQYDPQVIAMDEITSPEDVDALSVIAHCGTAVLATAHGSDLEALFPAATLSTPCCSSAFSKRLFLSGEQRAGEVTLWKRPHAALDRRTLCYYRFCRGRIADGCTASKTAGGVEANACRLPADGAGAQLPGA